MEKLRLFHINEKYINFLHGADNRVQLNKGERRPYVGIVLKINGNNYYVPMESPKPNHAKLKSGIHFLRIDNGNYGLLGFNNMIPVREDCLVNFDIEKESDIKYKTLLINQLVWCNKHREEIYDHAQKTYDKVISGNSKFHCTICCDFEKLERVSKKFDINYRKK